MMRRQDPGPRRERVRAERSRAGANVRSPVFSLAERSLYVERPRPLDRLDAPALALLRLARAQRPRARARHDRHDAGERADLPSRFERSIARAKQTSLLAERPRPACAFEEHAFNEPWSDGEHTLTLFPAGHVLGSAQLLIEGERGRFVYTGDFKLARSYTCEPHRGEAVRRAADGVHVRPPAVRLSVARRGRERDRRLRDQALADGCAPVFFAYSLGKAQEAMAILGKAGIPITVHGAVHAIARVYEDAGVQLPA